MNTGKILYCHYHNQAANTNTRKDDNGNIISYFFCHGFQFRSSLYHEGGVH